MIPSTPSPPPPPHPPPPPPPPPPTPIFIPNAGKYELEKTPYLDNFYAVILISVLNLFQPGPQEVVLVSKLCITTCDYNNLAKCTVNFLRDLSWSLLLMLKKEDNCLKTERGLQNFAFFVDGEWKANFLQLIYYYHYYYY